MPVSSASPWLGPHSFCSPSQWMWGRVHVQMWVQLAEVSTQLSTWSTWDVREGQSISFRCGRPRFKSRPCHLALWPWAHGISPGSLGFLICRMGWWSEPEEMVCIKHVSHRCVFMLYLISTEHLLLWRTQALGRGDTFPGRPGRERGVVQTGELIHFEAE